MQYFAILAATLALAGCSSPGGDPSPSQTNSVSDTGTEGIHQPIVAVSKDEPASVNQLNWSNALEPRPPEITRLLDKAHQTGGRYQEDLTEERHEELDAYMGTEWNRQQPDASHSPRQYPVDYFGSDLRINFYIVAGD